MTKSAVAADVGDNLWCDLESPRGQATFLATEPPAPAGRDTAGEVSIVAPDCIATQGEIRQIDDDLGRCIEPQRCCQHCRFMSSNSRDVTAPLREISFLTVSAACEGPVVADMRNSRMSASLVRNSQLRAEKRSNALIRWDEISAPGYIIPS